MINRRVFLRNSALAMVGVGSAPLWLKRALYADGTPTPRKKILVAIFQRGAADGLNVVVPHGEKAYYDLRPTIADSAALSAGDSAADAAIDLDGFFGLHPSLAPLKPLFDQQHLAIVDAVGSPDPTRSHFDAQDYMESGTPGLKATDSGWMNRALPKPQGKVSPVRAVALGRDAAAHHARRRSRRRAAEHRRVPGARRAGAPSSSKQMYAGQQGPACCRPPARETFEADGDAAGDPEAALHAGRRAPTIRARRFGDSLKQIAQLIKADVGMEMAFADIGGWDHHVNEVAQTRLRGPAGRTCCANSARR